MCELTLSYFVIIKCCYYYIIIGCLKKSSEFHHLVILSNFVENEVPVVLWHLTDNVVVSVLVNDVLW